jgi:hypothetical protein
MSTEAGCDHAGASLSNATLFQPTRLSMVDQNKYNIKNLRRAYLKSMKEKKS